MDQIDVAVRVEDWIGDCARNFTRTLGHEVEGRAREPAKDALHASSSLPAQRERVDALIGVSYRGDVRRRWWRAKICVCAASRRVQTLDRHASKASRRASLNGRHDAGGAHVVHEHTDGWRAGRAVEERRAGRVEERRRRDFLIALRIHLEERGTDDAIAQALAKQPQTPPSSVTVSMA